MARMSKGGQRSLAAILAGLGGGLSSFVKTRFAKRDQEEDERRAKVKEDQWAKDDVFRREEREYEKAEAERTRAEHKARDEEDRRRYEEGKQERSRRDEEEKRRYEEEYGAGKLDETVPTPEGEYGPMPDYRYYYEHGETPPTPPPGQGWKRKLEEDQERRLQEYHRSLGESAEMRAQRGPAPRAMTETDKRRGAKVEEFGRFWKEIQDQGGFGEMTGEAQPPLIPDRELDFEPEMGPMDYFGKFFAGGPEESLAGDQFRESIRRRLGASDLPSLRQIIEGYEQGQGLNTQPDQINSIGRGAQPPMHVSPQDAANPNQAPAGAGIGGFAPGEMRDKAATDLLGRTAQKFMTRQGNYSVEDWDNLVELNEIMGADPVAGPAIRRLMEAYRKDVEMRRQRAQQGSGMGDFNPTGAPGLY